MDYGHTFSKIIEMLPGADIMHGEAVNVDGFLCLVIAKRRGMISESVLHRVFGVMKSIGLPTIHEGVELALMVKVRCSLPGILLLLLIRTVQVCLIYDFLQFRSPLEETMCTISFVVGRLCVPPDRTRKTRKTRKASGDGGGRGGLGGDKTAFRLYIHR